MSEDISGFRERRRRGNVPSLVDLHHTFETPWDRHGISIIGVLAEKYPLLNPADIVLVIANDWVPPWARSYSDQYQFVVYRSIISFPAQQGSAWG